MEMMKHAVTEADRLGLEIGMHNCAGWATTGGPWVPPELAMQKLVTSELVVKGGDKVSVQLPQPEVTLEYYRDIAVFAIRADADSDHRLFRWRNKAGQAGSRTGRQPEVRELPDGAIIKQSDVIEVTDSLDDDGRLNWQAPEGEWKLIRIGHTPTGKINKPAPTEGTGLEIDKLRPEGLQLHWEKAIEPVLDHLGDAVGSTFNQVLIDSYEAGLHHWTPRMREEFRDRRGYDPGPMILALTGRVIEGGMDTERFLWDFRRTIADLFAEHYYGQMGELCRSHGLHFAVEPYTSTFEGLQVGSRADIPMGEFWVTGSYRNTLRMASSIANTNSLPIAAAEAFTAGPEIGRWLNHPGNLKYSGDMAWGEGINRLVIHSYAHQPWLHLKPGMTMGQYGIHFGRNNTWWEPGKAWLAYLARSQFLLQAGESVADVLCYAGDAAPNKAINRRDLTAAGYGYDSCSTEDFLSLRVEEGDIVLPTGRRYRLLVLPRHGFHRPDFARKLEELVAAGARIVGPRPLQSPGLGGQPEADETVRKIGQTVWGNCNGKEVVSHRHGKGEVFDGIKVEEVLGRMGVQPALSIPGDGEDISWVHRREGDLHWFFFANLTDRRVEGDWGFRVPEGRLPECFDAERGEIGRLPIRGYEKGRRWLPMSLDAGKSTFVVFRRSGKQAEISAEAVKGPSAVDWQFLSASNPGLRVWANGSYKLAGGNEDTHQIEVKELPNRKSLTGPWQVTFHSPTSEAEQWIGTPALFAWNEHEASDIRHFSGTARYKIAFEVSEDELRQSTERWLDLGEVGVIAEVFLNGKAIGTLWHPPFRIELGEGLKAGRNELEIRVTNLWINRLIGDAALKDDLEWEEKALKHWPDWLKVGARRPGPRTTFTTWNHWQKEDPLQPSGLIGPVRIQFARVIEVKP
jgi:hypothetical protein